MTEQECLEQMTHMDRMMSAMCRADYPEVELDDDAHLEHVREYAAGFDEAIELLRPTGNFTAILELIRERDRAQRAIDRYLAPKPPRQRLVRVLTPSPRAFHTWNRRQPQARAHAAGYLVSADQLRGLHGDVVELVVLDGADLEPYREVLRVMAVSGSAQAQAILDETQPREQWRCIVCSSEEHIAIVTGWEASGPTCGCLRDESFPCSSCDEPATVQRLERNACPSVDGIELAFCAEHAPPVGPRT